ncbi:hypothetical protein DMUE_4274 [Dictyocoela muelleri]|nr:hypothetical protein DMUE_4274 [Dictyocoela muelleri]
MKLNFISISVIIQFFIPFFMCCFDYSIDDKLKIVENVKNFIQDDKINGCNKYKKIANQTIKANFPLEQYNISKSKNTPVLSVEIAESFLKINSFKIKNEDDLTPACEEQYSFSDCENISIYNFIAQKIQDYVNKNFNNIFEVQNYIEKNKTSIKRKRNLKKFCSQTLCYCCQSCCVFCCCVLLPGIISGDNNHRSTMMGTNHTLANSAYNDEKPNDLKLNKKFNLPIALIFSNQTIKINQSEENIFFINGEKIDPIKRLNDELKKLSILNSNARYVDFYCNAEVKVLLNDTTAMTIFGYQNNKKNFVGKDKGNIDFTRNLIIAIGYGSNFNCSYYDFNNSAINKINCDNLNKNIFKITEYDEKVWDENSVKNNENPANSFSDFLCGNYKFVDLVNKAISGELNINDKLDLDEINRINNGEILTEEHEKINEIIGNIKGRSFSIVSSIVFGIITSQFEIFEKNLNKKYQYASNPSFEGNSFDNFDVTLYLNGTIFENENNLRMFKNEIRELSLIYKKLPFEKFNFVVSRSASIEGGAYYLLNQIN